MTATNVYLVTGASGVIGAAVVPLLLSEPDTEVRVLLRATSDTALSARLSELMQFWAPRIGVTDGAGRLQAVRGDVGQTRLGLDARGHDALAASVTNIIHAAGEVRLNQSLEQARTLAIGSATEVVAFARRCASARGMAKLEYLSTVGVAGRRAGTIPEEPLANASGYHNTYEQAKAEAEAIVLREIERGLPATIHRPSMVVGDSRDGVVRRFQVFYHLLRFIAGSRTRGWLPAFGDARLDLVPADYVARALVACSRRDDAVGRILHLCAGPTGAIRLADLGERLRVFLASRGETVFRPRYLPLPAMRALLAVATPLSPGSVRRALATLPFFLDYLRDPQLFEHERTSRFLEGGGIVAPPIVRFLEPVLDYWYTRSSRHADAAEA
ncbi:MAG TPA: SDR family oxidoreductase [Casimicrobiaceae bacterium]|nr:SDR family oxidoreductase [Casimicrobiaceae bacterium]